VGGPQSPYEGLWIGIMCTVGTGMGTWLLNLAFCSVTYRASFLGKVGNQHYNKHIELVVQGKASNVRIFCCSLHLIEE